MFGRPYQFEGTKISLCMTLPVKHLWWSFLARIDNRFKLFTIFVKNSIQDVWQGQTFGTIQHYKLVLISIE